MAHSGKCYSDFDCEGSSVCCRLTISQDKACHTRDECYPSTITSAPYSEDSLFAVLFGVIGALLLMVVVYAVIRFRADIKLRLMGVEVPRIPPVQAAPQSPSTDAPPAYPAPQPYPPNPHIQAQPVWIVTYNYQNNINPPSYDEAVKIGDGFQNVRL